MIKETWQRQMKVLFQFTWLIEWKEEPVLWCPISGTPTGLGEWPRAHEGQNSHFPSYFKGKRPSKFYNTMGAFLWQKAEFLPQLAFCYAWLWTALIKDFCLNPIQKLKPNFNFPWSIFWWKATFRIFSSFKVAHVMFLKRMLHKMILPQYSRQCC